MSCRQLSLSFNRTKKHTLNYKVPNTNFSSYFTLIALLPHLWHIIIWVYLNQYIVFAECATPYQYVIVDVAISMLNVLKLVLHLRCEEGTM